MSGNADAVTSRRHLTAAKPTSKQSGPAPQKLVLVGAKASTKFSVVVTGKGKAAVTTQVIQVTKGATAGTIVRSASSRPVVTCPPLRYDESIASRGETSSNKDTPQTAQIGSTRSAMHACPLTIRQCCGSRSHLCIARS